MGSEGRARGTTREPTLAELRAFVAVGEELHFRRAAARLGVAPPPLSQTIRRLEDKVGAVLMIRTPRAVELTEAGEELLTRSRDILERMAEAQAAVRAVGQSFHTARLTVGILSNGFAELTGPILDAFARAHPRTRLRLIEITTEPAAGIPTGVADIALIRPPIIDGDDPRLLVEVLVDEVRAAIVSPRHPISDAGSASIADLVDDPFIATGPPEIRDYWAAVDERDGEVNFGVEAWTVPGVLRGVGYMDNVITSFPSILRFFNVPGLVAVPLVDVAPAPMAIVTLRDDRRPAVADFRATARAVSEAMIRLVPGASFVGA